MELTGNTVLITGGATGIGFALAEHFLDAGSEVIICGRREDALRAAQDKRPKLHTHVCDVGLASARVSLRDWAVQKFPRLNVLVNNAGIQRRMQVTEGDFWEQAEQELAINLSAPMHLASLFAPHLATTSPAYIFNVTSGLAFSPLTMAPVYSATKAALRSFTLSLRHQLAASPIKVVEIIPPAVNTDLGGVGLHTFGAPLKDFSEAVKKGLLAGDLEIAYGMAEKASKSSRQELDQMFQRMNQAN